MDEPLRGSFSYLELECDQAAGLLAGRAVGNGSAYIPPGRVGGRWRAPDDVVPRQPSALRIGFDFVWVRVANGASIQLDDLEVTAEVPGLGDVTIVDDATASRAQAHFVPPSFEDVPTCTDPARNVTGGFAGSVEIGEHDPPSDDEDDEETVHPAQL